MARIQSQVWWHFLAPRAGVVPGFHLGPRLGKPFYAWENRNPSPKPGWSVALEDEAWVAESLIDGAEWKLTSSFWFCRVVVSHEHPSHPDTGDCSDQEVASLSSQPTSPSPGSSVTSSACASPQPSLSHNLWNSVCMNVQLRVHQFASSFFLIWVN